MTKANSFDGLFPPWSGGGAEACDKPTAYICAGLNLAQSSELLTNPFPCHSILKETLEQLLWRCDQNIILEQNVIATVERYLLSRNWHPVPATSTDWTDSMSPILPDENLVLCATSHWREGGTTGGTPYVRGTSPFHSQRKFPFTQSSCDWKC